MTQVRAKFKVQSVTMSAHWQQGKGIIGTVKLVPVTSGSEENKKFYETTPSGSIDVGTVNQQALDFFKIGHEFYVDFTAAPSEPAV